LLLGPLRQRLVVFALLGRGLSLGLVADLPDRRLRPGQVGLGRLHDTVGLGPGLVEVRGSLLTRLVEELLALMSGIRREAVDLGQLGTHVALGIVTVRRGIRLGLCAKRGRLTLGDLAQTRDLECGFGPVGLPGGAGRGDIRGGSVEELTARSLC